MRRLAPALLLLVACGGDPVLEALDESMEYYDAGRAALAEGDAREARRAFAKARETQPDAPLLLAWEAHALAVAGRDAEALSLLDEGLARWPDHPDLLYNRAALRSRSGQLEGAASDLRQLYRRGLLHPTEAADDPDFAPLAAHPDTAELVPPPTVEVTARGEEGAVLLGEPWELELDLTVPGDAPLALRRRGSASGLLALDEVVEEILDEDGPTRRHRLRLRWRAVQPGTTTVGPWQLTAGSARGQVAARPVQVTAVPGRQGADPPPQPKAIPLPSTAGAADPRPRISENGVWTVISAPPDARVQLRIEDDTPQPLRLELRRDDRSLVVHHLLPAGTEGQATVQRGTATLLDQPLP